MLLSSWVLSLLSLLQAIDKLNSEEYDSEIDWQCGTDDFTKYISENQIDIDCPVLKEPINKCCLVHDSCYDDQLGRTYCDDSFCQCLDEATRSSVICNKEDGPLFCGMVRHFGEEAYRRSGNGTTEFLEDFRNSSTSLSLLSSNSSDYDYESEVRLNNTADGSSLQDHADLLDVAIKELAHENHKSY